jgi:hypothetical protein
MALSGHMKWDMMFENREGHWRQGSARLRLGQGTDKITGRGRAGEVEAFLADVSVGASLKGGYRDYGRLLVRCPRKEGVRVTVTTLTYRWLYSRDKCR